MLGSVANLFWYFFTSVSPGDKRSSEVMLIQTRKLEFVPRPSQGHKGSPCALRLSIPAQSRPRERSGVVVFDWVGGSVTLPALAVDEIWAGAARRDGERSLELFVHH